MIVIWFLFKTRLEGNANEPDRIASGKPRALHPTSVSFCRVVRIRGGQCLYDSAPARLDHPLPEGGKVDLWGQRFIEVWSGMPTLFLIILLSSVVQPNFWWLLAITVLFGWMALVGVVRAEFLRTRNFDYIRAAQALGVGDRGIIFRHMLPNAMVATLTFLPFIMCSSITTLTSLDFLGFGLPLGSPSLGELLLQGKNNLQAPWLGITAFISVALLLSLLIFIGEAVRDAFDPNKAV
jgi:microcin C transport system permease protein